MTEGIRVSTHNFKYAAWHLRLAALIIDQALMKIMVFLVVPGSFKITSLVFGQHWSEIPQFMLGSDGMWLLIMPFAYMLVMQGVFSRTLGMILLKMRIANLDGKRIDWLKATLRTFGFILCLVTFGLGFLPILFDKKRQGLHDRLTKTMVVMK